MLTVSGAYGRDYKSAKAANEDWTSGKDFVVRTFGPEDGLYSLTYRYINIADHPAPLKIRYSSDRKILVTKAAKL